MGFIGENKLKYVKKISSDFKINAKIIEHSPFLIIMEDYVKMDELYKIYEKVINN
jgi:hypothetical protein